VTEFCAKKDIDYSNNEAVNAKAFFKFIEAYIYKAEKTVNSENDYEDDCFEDKDSEVERESVKMYLREIQKATSPEWMYSAWLGTIKMFRGLGVITQKALKLD
jgi:hypothetical protein